MTKSATDSASNAATRQRLLEAAGEVFAEIGFQRATVRDICQRAKANVAAVNYHFRDKEGLYVEVVRYAQGCAMQKLPNGPPDLSVVPPDMRLRMFIAAFLERAIGKDRLTWHGKMMAKEMSEPTAMLDKIVTNEIRPRADILEGALRELLGPGAMQQQVEMCARSVVSQCIFYHLCRPVIDRLHPNQKYESDDVKALADHIADFTLNAVRGLAAAREGESMNFVAIKMLIGDRAKYLGIIMGLTFASLLITQQMAIFLGLMTRTFGAITDTGTPDIWVMNEKVQFIDDIKPLQDTALFRVRGVQGVQWAMPLYKGIIKARLDNGNFQSCNVFGLDDATLVGGPPEMVADANGRTATVADLRRSEGVLVDENGANDKLAKKTYEKDHPDREIVSLRKPLVVGDVLELNDHRAIVVGICRVSRTFQSQPVIYTTYNRATTFAPQERRLLSFVLVKARPGVDQEELCGRIEANTGLSAHTREQFKWMTIWYFMKYTGIPINFGISVTLGFIVGTAIAGQTFYNFTLENLRHFGALKAMGARNGVLLRMILLQSTMVGVIGYGLGVGLASLFGFLTQNSELAFFLPWQLLVFSAGAVISICVAASLLSIRKVIQLEPAIVFKG